jgi:DNA end-binding protein Ku
MALLNYDEEIRPPAEAAAGLKAPRGLNRKVQLAQTLIRTWSAKDFDFRDYDDPYRERVQALIDAKIAGRDIEQPPEEEEPEIHNLMDALKQSLARTGRGKSRGKKRRSA